VDSHLCPTLEGPTRAPKLISRRGTGDRAAFRCPVTTDDLECWGSCGIPSAWHRPPTRLPGGSIPAHRRPSFPGLPPGSRGVALGEVGGMPHLATPPKRAWRLCRPSRRSARPARACFLGRTAVADVAPLGELRPALGVRDRRSPAKTPVDVGLHQLVLGSAVCTQFVPKQGAAILGQNRALGSGRPFPLGGWVVGVVATPCPRRSNLRS
jgi:hypothetical protein